MENTNKTYSAIPGDDRCECFDSGCSHPTSGNSAQCTNKATQTLWRVDIADVDGTRFCDDCAEDAIECGLFVGLEDE